jgi:beta-lactamase regulating signal transducer with metallopeptidase domain
MPGPLLDDFVVQLGIKATMLLVAAALLVALLRRSSAAVRHRVWAATLASLVVLPLLAGILPSWNLNLPGVSVSSSSFVDGPSAASAAFAEVAAGHGMTRALSPDGPERVPGPWTLLLWGGGLAGVGVWILSGMVGARRLRRTELAQQGAYTFMLERARERTGVQTPVGLATSAALSVPVVVGLRHPVIVLPGSASEWPEERLERVLVHELAHVGRRDNLFNLVGRFACALFWFHPLVWIAAHRLRLECEHAADDVVLSAGARASDYARDLLSLAGGARAERATAAVALMNRTPVARRISALLDPRRSHVPAPQRVGVLATLASGSAVLLLACVTPSGSASTQRPEHVTVETSPLATFDADGALVDLLAVDAPSTIQRSSAFPMTLYWRVRTTFPEDPVPEERWRVFVHFDGPLPLEDSQPRTRFQADHSVSAAGQWWLNREVVEDRFAVMAGRRDYPRGRYAIYVGWFKGAPGTWTNAELAVSRGAGVEAEGDRLRVGEIELQ